jgi:hypothetical protein
MSYRYALSLTSQFYFCGLPLRLDSYKGCPSKCIYCFVGSRQGFYPNIVDEKYKPTPYVKETENKYWEKRLLHIKGLKKYAEKFLHENNVERLKIDIQQLYLLHVNEKYKNAFLSTLRRILFWGILLISISVMSLFALIVLNKIWPSWWQLLGKACGQISGK